jgi:hypothetical protein
MHSHPHIGVAEKSKFSMNRPLSYIFSASGNSRLEVLAGMGWK